MQRINENKLLDEGDGTYSHEGHPFSGVAFELFPNGDLRSEITYVEGHQEGVARDWYESGQLKFEGIYLGSTLHGTAKEWFPDGRVKSESLSEFGICLWEKEWDEDGKLVKDFILAETDYNYEILLKYRAIYGKRK